MILKPLPENIGIVKASAAVAIVVPEDSHLNTNLLANLTTASLPRLIGQGFQIFLPSLGT